MARIRDCRPKETTGSYERLFSIPALGSLISRVQSTVISSGTELREMIVERVAPIEDLDAFLTKDIMPEGVFLAPKSQVRKCATLNFPQGGPGFLVFKRGNGGQGCYIIALKDGHVFDDKKATAERDAVYSFVEHIAQRLEQCGYRVHHHFCAFNQSSRDAIVRGFKDKITIEEAMTGRKFCELLELDYDEIVKARQVDQPDNVDVFLDELLRIDEVKTRILHLLNPRG